MKEEPERVYNSERRGTCMFSHDEYPICYPSLSSLCVVFVVLYLLCCLCCVD